VVPILSRAWWIFSSTGLSADPTGAGQRGASADIDDQLNFDDPRVHAVPLASVDDALGLMTSSESIRTAIA